jgi:hypothetical protein
LQFQGVRACLQRLAGELYLVALDVLDQQDLELGEVVQGEVADGIAEDAFLREGSEMKDDREL